MAHWIARWQHRRQQRKVDRAALQVVGQGQGAAARTWPVHPALTTEARAVIQQEALAWLTENSAVAVTPYGWSDCTIFMALARVHARQRTPLWKATLPSFRKTEREPALAQAAAQLASVPFADYPTATQLEVYLLDMGTVLRESFARIADESVEKKGG